MYTDQPTHTTSQDLHGTAPNLSDEASRNSHVAPPRRLRQTSSDSHGTPPSIRSDSSLTHHVIRIARCMIFRYTCDSKPTDTNDYTTHTHTRINKYTDILTFLFFSPSHNYDEYFLQCSTSSSFRSRMYAITSWFHFATPYRYSITYSTPTTRKHTNTHVTRKYIRIHF